MLRYILTCLILSLSITCCQAQTLEAPEEQVLPDLFEAFETIPTLPNGMPIWASYIDFDAEPTGSNTDRWKMLPTLEHHQAVVKISTKLPLMGLDYPVMGSGTVIETTKDTVTILTAYHVTPLLDTKKTIDIGYSDRSVTVNITPELWADEANDLAILRIKRNPEIKLGSMSVAKEPPKIEDIVTYAGFGGASLGLRRFKSKIKRMGPFRFASNIDCIGGDSGGPVTNSAEEIVGVMSCGSMRHLCEQSKLTLTWPLTSIGHGPIQALMTRYETEEPDYGKEKRVETPDGDPEVSGSTRLVDPKHAWFPVSSRRARHLLFPPGVSDTVGGSQSQRQVHLHQRSETHVPSVDKIRGGHLDSCRCNHCRVRQTVSTP